MKILHSIMFTLVSAFTLTATLPSCSSDDPETDDQLISGETDSEDSVPGTGPADENTGFWQQPHTVLLGLKGAVSSLTSTLHTPDDGEDEEGLSTWMRFDMHGRITYYNPTGVVENRMLGMEMESYAYSYDEQGHMVQAVATTLGEGRTVYTMTYQSDGLRYVPLPFTVGGLELCMTRGLTSLSSDAEGFTCTMSDTEVTYTQTTYALRGTMQTVTTYAYADADACLPGECTVRTLYDGEELSADRTRYEFDPVTGRLLSLIVERTEGGELTEMEVRTYHSTFPLCLLSKAVTTPYGDIDSYNYDYDEQGRLTGITLTDSEGNTAEETYTYAAPDNWDNWTRADYYWNSLVDLNHWDGIVNISRTLEYYETK